MVSLVHLQQAQLIRTVFAFTWTYFVGLHSSLIPYFPSTVLEPEDRLRQVDYLVGIVHNSVGIWDELGHELGKFVIPYSRLT